MSASINNNLTAANAASNLNSHYGKLATSVERLSSGLRINSAADDAAGLAIRELMRADVAALNQGVRNANDAISMLQVADGALGIIDEKLIRMKELAEQAATGTYDSTQRLMIHSEFVAMGEEIDRIAKATDFNGIKLLDGSLSGAHDGTGLNSTGKMKIHFGSANDSAEDYYYVEIGDCTLAGLGLRGKSPADVGSSITVGGKTISINDCPEGTDQLQMPLNYIPNMEDIIPNQGQWYNGIYKDPPGAAYFWAEEDFMFIIPKGSKNVVINMLGAHGIQPPPQPGQIVTVRGDNDINLYTMSGVHLAGQTLDDIVYRNRTYAGTPTPEGMFDRPAHERMKLLPFGSAGYDPDHLNTGPAQYDGTTLNYSTYNGMNIGYTGDSDQFDLLPNNAASETWEDYETLIIDEVTEDLIVWMPGAGSANFKVYWEADTQTDENSVAPGEIISIETQQQAQQALKKIDDAIVAKDKVRAHLGALQNRLENTVTNLTIQSENLQAAESRISDTDVATEMIIFVRNQVLTQSAVAMLGQANSYPHMLSRLITG